MASASPTQRTLQECRKREWLCCVVEKWVPHARRRIDVFGFGDLLALDGEQGSLLIQATSTSNMGSRVTKIRKDCNAAARAWLEAGNRIEVWGWAKRGATGKRKLWTLRSVRVTLTDLNAKG